MADKNIVYRTSYFQNVPLMVLLVLSTALLIYSYQNWAWSVVLIDIFGKPMQLSLFALPVVFFTVVLFSKTHNNKLILTDEYVLFIEDIMRWKRKSIRMEYDAIKEVSIEETLLQRIFGLGDLICQTGPNSGQRLAHMIGLRNPRIVKDVIMARILKVEGKI